MTSYTRTTRDTHECLTVDTAEHFGADPDGGKWIVFCETHGYIVNVDTKAIALGIRGIDFCDDCREDAAAQLLIEAQRTARIAEAFAELAENYAADVQAFAKLADDTAAGAGTTLEFGGTIRNGVFTITHDYRKDSS